MKPLFFGLFLLISISINAQAPLNVDTSSIQYKAGMELAIAGRHYYHGLETMLGGAVITTLGAVTQNDKPLLITGAAVSVVGLVYVIESFSHIQRAGMLMNGERKLSFGSTQSGIGFAYRL